MRIRGLKIGLKTALIVGALGVTGAAAATGVTLPSHANQHAKDHVNGTSSPSPNPHASFGQCVAANAKTASDHKADHGQGSSGWNPTQGCAKPNGGQDNGTDASNGAAHANLHASNGMSHASLGASNANNP